MKDLKVFAEKLDLVAIGEQLKKFPEAYMPTTHHFGDGQYVRETFFPRGTMAIGKKHRYSVVNILLEGRILVVMGDERKEIVAPCVFISEAGIQKVAYFLEDTRWVNCHPTNSTDLTEIEKDVIISENEHEFITYGGSDEEEHN